jgi:hypothetical protein
LPLGEIHARLSWARVHLAAEGAAAAPTIEACLAAAAVLIDQTEARVHEPFIRVERAALARLTADETTRQGELREAHRLFTEMGAPTRAEDVAFEL